MSTLELYERLKPKLGHGWPVPGVDGRCHEGISILRGGQGETESQALLEHIDQLRRGSVAQEEFQKELSELVTKGMLKAELAELKVSLMRWMFALWATQMLAIIALFLRK